MGIGIREAVEPIDVEGLPVYRTTKMIKERVGDEIHLLHGHEVFGRIVWTHVEIWQASDLMVEAGACTEISMRPRKQLTPAGH